MDEEVRRRLEYEEQFFGMSSKFFSDCFKTLILEELDSKINMMVESLNGKLSEQTKNREKFEIALQKMKQDLRVEYTNAVDKSFSEIESKISEFIHIPSTVVLKEDLPVIEGVNGDLNEIKEKIENLKGTYCCLLYLKQKILKEMEEAESAIFFMEDFVNGKKIDFKVLPVKEISALSKENKLLINNEF